MASGEIIPRLVKSRPVEALDDSPAVLIDGPRQSGRTTLAQTVGGKRGYRYFNLDSSLLSSDWLGESFYIGCEPDVSAD